MTLKSFFIPVFALLLLLTSTLLIHQNNFYRENYKPFPFATVKKEPFYSFLASISGFRCNPSRNGKAVP